MKIIRYCLYSILLLFIGINQIMGQSRAEIDSLNNMLLTTPQDTNRIKIYGELCWIYASTREKLDTARLHIGKMHNIFIGKYSFNPSSGDIDLNNIEGQVEQVEIAPGVYVDVTKPLYFDDFSNLKMISCHFMIDRKGAEGSTIERVFERRSGPFGWVE